MPKEAKGVTAAIRQNKRFVKGTHGAEIYPAVGPVKGDLVVEGRKGVSGFTGSNLDYILRSNGIRHVFVAGFITEVCVESSIREAYEKGYGSTLVSSCTAGHSKEDQSYVEHTIMPYFGEVLSSDEIIAKWNLA